MKIAGLEILRCDAGWRNYHFLKLTTEGGHRRLERVRRGLWLARGQRRRRAHGAAGRGPKCLRPRTDLRGALLPDPPGCRGVVGEGLGAIENAVLDAKAKALKVPCHALLGGKIRDRVRVYWSHCATWRINHPNFYKPAITGLELQPGANTIQVVDRIKAMLPRLEASIPRAVHVDLVSDRSANIRASVSDVEFTLALTVGLVVLVIFAFLRKLWATIIPSITLPLVIIASFSGMYFLGYSVDNLSLMALTISVGFLVDDAIVMIENIVRYIEAGDPPLEAALKGAGQIGFTIISMTLSLIAVFIPLLFMSGVVGLLFHEFAMTMTLTLLYSALVSLTLTPMMCSLFLPRENEPEKRRRGLFERGFDRLRDGYDRGLQWTFRHRLPMLLLTLALIALTGVLYAMIPKGFLPEQDTGFIFAAVQARQDTSFAAMTKIENQCARIFTRDPAVSGVVGFAGATGANASESTAGCLSS